MVIWYTKNMKKNNLKLKINPQDIQDNIFKKMSAGKKVKLVSQFFEFGKKLNNLNGNRRPSYNNS